MAPRGRPAVEATATGTVLGYVALSAAQVERAFPPKGQQRNRPDSLPVTLLGQLAIHKDHHGQGHTASVRTAEIVGSIGVITHPLDDGVRAFYAKWGFQDLRVIRVKR